MLHRASSDVNLPILSQKHIVIMGGGSVGGYCAHNLAHLVGQLTIVDPEVVAEENIERHLAGYEHIGQPKVEVIAQITSDHYCIDSNIIVPIQQDGIEALPSLKDVDLVIEATNDPTLRYELNIWAQDFNVPVIYAGVYAGGNGWQTVALPRPRKVCYMCLELTRIIETKRDRAELGVYGGATQPDNDGQLHAATGLVSAVMALAATAAQQAINLLQEDSVESFLYRTTYLPRDFMALGDETSLKMARLAIELLQPLGIDLFGLVEGSEGFTLQQKAGSIPLIIRQAPGCPFHDTPLEGVVGG